MGVQQTNKIKIAAPKPIRARPLGLTHMSNTAKWIETSPIKCENNNLSGQVDSKMFQSGQKETSIQFAEFLKMPKLNFQIEQNLSYEDESSQIHNLNNNSQNSELRSIMEAEQELSEIFSRSRQRYQDISSCPTSQLGFSTSSQWSPDKTNNFRLNNLNQSTSTLTQPDLLMGFSKFGHFKAPIKRPTCNPIVKDERFKRLNNVNEVTQSQSNNQNLNTQDTMTDCNSQDVIPNPYNQNKMYIGLQDLDSHNQSNYMFAFSQTTSPTAYSSRLHPFTSQMDHSGHYENHNIPSNFQNQSANQHNFSWYNQSVNHQANANSHIQFNDLYTQQMQIQSQTRLNLQAQTPHFNLSNSAPEYYNSYLNMHSMPIQAQYPTYEFGLVSGELQLQDPSEAYMNHASFNFNEDYQQSIAGFCQQLEFLDLHQQNVTLDNQLVETAAELQIQDIAE
eukprot:403362992